MIGSKVFNYGRSGNSTPKLSLVALMDIFTILVFFLLLNSGEAQKIENAKFVKLPDSTKGANPHEEIMISVNSDEIWIGKEMIASVNEVFKNADEIIKPLAEKLQENTDKIEELTPYQKENGLSVIVMGDKGVPYALLKSIMTTCRLKNYRNISLAVNKVVASNSGDMVFSSSSVSVEGGK